MPCICNRRQIGEDIGCILQLEPIELDVLTRGEMPITAIILTRDMRKHAHLFAQRSGRRAPRFVTCTRVSACTSRFATAAAKTLARSTHRKGDAAPDHGTASTRSSTILLIIFIIAIHHLISSHIQTEMLSRVCNKFIIIRLCFFSENSIYFQIF
jgi:hypothetical protein